MPPRPGQHLHNQVALHPRVRLALRPPFPQHRSPAQGRTNTGNKDRIQTSRHANDAPDSHTTPPS
ncbi:hypothetical protein ACFRQM_24950 [Streptomyces sp. NPDC056831]|uniref:hypothetical protein n=1 Tax=Streptomyces sp. NPDC056831 TaxID=3345954 RepID=UPI0036931188